jgi:hypothetical protein
MRNCRIRTKQILLQMTRKEVLDMRVDEVIKLYMDIMKLLGLSVSKK